MCITTYSLHIKQTIKGYNESFYVNKFDNFDKMDQFYEIYKLPKIYNKAWIPKSIREIEFVVKNILTEKIPIPNDFIGDCFQKTKGNIFQLTL